MENKLYLTTTVLLALSFMQSARAELPECESVVKGVNQQLEKKNKVMIKDEKKLAALLKTLNRGNILPAEYVTTEQAVKLGWSGKAEDSLWSIWTLNKKLLGGDIWRGGGLPENIRWFSADIYSVRGFRGPQRLIYSPDSSARYLTSDNGTTLEILPPCR